MTTVEEILHSPAAVLLYEPESAHLAREVMTTVVHELSSELGPTDPGLDSLTVIDTKPNLEHWQENFGYITVTSVAEIASGEYPLHHHQCVVALTPEFLRRRMETSLLRAPRLYALSPAVASRRFAKAGLPTIHLEDVA